jgi:ubiquinone/menaquinone biosynthesis C-methylase UbiE
MAMNEEAPEKIQQQVSSHYSSGSLEQTIFAALLAAGKNVDQLRSEDLSGIDEFHLGGLEATQELASFMHLHPGMHLLDVGCGIGGPARYLAESGCHVTGVDLTPEFIRAAQRFTRLVKLESQATFVEASALALPFDSGTFDGAYQIHVGMNIADKAGVFREVARVLKPGARFAIYDIMRTGDGPLNFPVPWARQADTSVLATPDEYRRALQDAGFQIEHERERRQYAIDFLNRMRALPEPPVLGVHVLMGELAPLMMQNVTAPIVSGVIAPIELVAVAQ